MYERMLDKHTSPSIEEMTAYCGDCGSLFTALNEWITNLLATESKVVFPYGNKYGWGIAHHRKAKLICNIFAENGAFTVMLRMTDKQFQFVYGQLSAYAQHHIDHKYPCGDGGWIHYRVSCQAHLTDIQTLLSLKKPKVT